jgi:hypothetical protein
VIDSFLFAGNTPLVRDVMAAASGWCAISIIATKNALPRAIARRWRIWRLADRKHQRDVHQRDVQQVCSRSRTIERLLPAASRRRPPAASLLNITM